MLDSIITTTINYSMRDIGVNLDRGVMRDFLLSLEMFNGDENRKQHFRKQA
jgi:hypothetical protein